jgi:hypothetical protein
MNDLNLPRFDIPELPPREMTFEEYCRWVNRYVEKLLRSGEYASVRAIISSSPVDVRFRL